MRVIPLQILISNMRQLRTFRILLAIIFFIASALYLYEGAGRRPMADISFKSQIILSMITMTIGATITWLLLTFLIGRVYCSTVCPVGALTDLFARTGRLIPRRDKDYRWKRRAPWSGYLLMVYILSLLLGFLAVAYIVEPWNIMRNIVSIARPEATALSWQTLGVGAAVSIIAGILSLLFIAGLSLRSGRDFCTDLCPLGAALGAVSNNALLHIEIDTDKCVYCGKCEAGCSAHCIRLKKRYVDNARCLRCFDCLSACEYDAIRLQLNRNVPLTPLFRRKTEAR